MKNTQDNLSRSLNSHHFYDATSQHPRESPRHVPTSFPGSSLFLHRGRKREDPGNEVGQVRRSARIYDVRIAQFVLKIEKLSHIIGVRGSQGLRSPSPIIAPESTQSWSKSRCAYAPLHFKTEKVAETALRAAWFWRTLGRFPGTWGIFFSPGDSKLTRDGLGFRWNGQR